MKVTPSRPLGGPAAAKKKSAATGAESFAPQSNPGAGAPAGGASVSAASAVGSVDALLALQGAEDFQAARRQATDRAFNLLDMLDDLKLALLDGSIPRDTLMRLMDTLKTQREATNDPKLEAALDEVEIRAAVELAKHGA